MAKILLVEDDKSLREIYGVRLMAEGYEIVSAGDGEEALALAIKERPDLILSDVMMPKISGFDMLDILRSTTETKDVRVIMMTALSSEDQRARGEALGADRYLVKSQVGIEDVVRTVHEVIGDANPQGAAPAAPQQFGAAVPVAAPEMPVQQTPVPELPATPAPMEAPVFTVPIPETPVFTEEYSAPAVAPVEMPQMPEMPVAPAVEQPAPMQFTEPAMPTYQEPAPIAPAPVEMPMPAAPVQEQPTQMPQPVMENPMPTMPEAPVPQPVAMPVMPEPVAPVTFEQPIAPAPMEASVQEQPIQMPQPAPMPTPVMQPEVPVAMPVEPTSPAEFIAPTPVAPSPFETPVPPAPQPVASSLPEPTAPFSSPAPASLGERVIEPLVAPAPTDASVLGQNIAAQMAQALEQTPPTPPAQ